MSVKTIVSPLMIGVLLLGAFLVYINLPQEQATSENISAPTPVRTVIAEEQMFPVTIEALGTTKANESVMITAQQTDVVTQVNFDDGDTVEAGQLLVQLNNVEEQARIAELEANMVEASRQLERVTNLARTSAASQQILDEQQARLKALDAQLDVAKARLNELQIRAPFAGLLGIRNVSKGSLIQPGDLITTLDDLSVIKVDFSVAEGQLASLAQGQRVMAGSAAYPGQVFEGEIKTIDSRVDPVSRSVLVRAVIDNSDGKLRPGMLLRVTLEKEILQTLTIPEKALVPVDERQFVFVVNEGVVEQRQVKIGERKPGIVEIVEGLKAGEQVVTEGTLRVQDESKVRVLDNSGV